MDYKAHYYLVNSLLTRAELHFYEALVSATVGWAVITPKVRLADLFNVRAPNGSSYYTAFNQISAKHVDFVLCDPQTLRPLIAVELNDSSHDREDRLSRDEFVVGVFDGAGLPLVGIRLRDEYPVGKLKTFLREKAGLEERPQRVLRDKPAAYRAQPPRCPRCGKEMVLRKAHRGPNAGSRFWGCSDYPRCKGIVAV